MRHAAAAILVLATALRMLRGMVRWEEWSLHYASYNLSTATALRNGEWFDALTTWAGLHPPLYPLIHAAIETVWPAPFLWFALSLSASVLAVFLVLRASPNSILPAFLLATDPFQLHYAAEINNYPLATAWIALGWWATAQNRNRWFIVAAVGAGWTHLLAGVVVISMALVQRHRWSMLPWIALGLLPLVPEAWSLASDPGTFRQPAFLLVESMTDVWARFGLTPFLFIPLVIMGIQHRPEAGFGWLGGAVFWVAMVACDIAAPHQFPYATTLGVPAAVLITAGLPSTRWIPGVGAIALAQAIWFGGQDVSRITSLVQDQKTDRGIDMVMTASRPGDAIVLVRGAGAPDDDRRHSSGTMWRLNPFQRSHAIVTTARPDTVGQPRVFSGRKVYTFNHATDFLASISEERVFTVAYDGAEHNLDLIPEHPRQGPWTTAGSDRWRGPLSPPTSP